MNYLDHEQLSAIVEESVLSAISENQSYVTKSLADGLAWEDGWEKTLSRAVFNAVRVSTRLSVQLTLTMLIEKGVLEVLPDDHPPKLELLLGGNGSGERG